MIAKDFLDFKGLQFFGDENTKVESISYDSRAVGSNCAFFALNGHFTDGANFIKEALDKGASLIISQTKQEISAPQIVVENVLEFMAFFSAKFYGRPDKELKIIGVTGTNGKTSFTYMLESILSQNGISCAVFGTINYRYGGKTIEAQNTTPQSADLYRMMREAADLGVKCLIMEVSSHSLVLGRILGIEFDIAVFTNLTQDHLDFHKDMDDYFKAKLSLFNSLENQRQKSNIKYAIINADDKYGRRIAKTLKKSEIKLYSVKETVADFRAEDIEVKLSGSFFNILLDGGKIPIEIKHLGLHNVYNALAAAAAAFAAGIDKDKIARSLISMPQAPGRLERVDTKDLGFEIAVDYAHTEDALKNVLSALNEMKQNKIISVFGCGGDRDRTKRPKMGKIAAQMSAFVFVTSDNPRTEDPALIILDIELGIKRAGLTNFRAVVDRETAIKEAVMSAEKGDIILIAGKGHENYQIIGREKRHFDDKEIAEKYIELRRRENLDGKREKQQEFDFQ